MNSKHVEILTKFFSVLKNPPTVKLDEDVSLDEPVILIGDGHFTIRNSEVERSSIVGKKYLQGFALDVSVYRAATRWEPDEQDYCELFADVSFHKVAAAAVKKYAEDQINCMTQQESWEGMYSEYKQAELDDKNAFKEGIAAYNSGKAENENPYPYGISVFYKWHAGWNNAEMNLLLLETAAKSG